MVIDLIPDGAQVHHGASQTLDMTGITAAIEKPGRYDLLRRSSVGWSRPPKTQATRSAASRPRRT